MTIGIFDSGIGGLTVLKAIRHRLPDAPICYVADFGHAPYGPRSADDIAQRSQHIIRWLHDRGATLVVAACHSSSAVLQDTVLAHMPCPVLTMIEPTVSCIMHQAQTKQWRQGLGLLGTALTIQQGRLAHALRDLGFGLTITSVACPGLAEIIETLEWEKAHDYVHQHIAPMFAQHPVDMLVYGCTHYPFIHPWLEEQNFAWSASLMDPAQEVSNLVMRTYKDDQSLPTNCAASKFMDNVSTQNTSDPTTFYYTGIPNQGHVRLARHWPLAHSTHTTLSIP